MPIEADDEKGEKAAERSEREQESVDNYDGSGIINTKLLKLNSDGTVVSPMSKEKYYSMRSKLENKGCTVVPAYGDDRRFLEAMGAEAISDQIGIMHMGDIPSASDFFEEIIHYSQIQKYGVVNETDYLERAAREVAANRKLMKHGKLYGFTKYDFEDI